MHFTLSPPTARGQGLTLPHAGAPGSRFRKDLSAEANGYNRQPAWSEGKQMIAPVSPLLTDLYQLNMMQAYLDHGETKTAVFEFFVRKLPARRGFLLAAGLEQALDFLEQLRFTPEEIDWLQSTGRFGRHCSIISRVCASPAMSMRMPEGTVFFADEPILRVTAPLPQAQLVETRLINIMHFQTLVASKAARMVLAAPGKLWSISGCAARMAPKPG